MIEKFIARTQNIWNLKPMDLEKCLSESIHTQMNDTIDELRENVDRLEDTVARLITALYSNGNGPTGFHVGLTIEQINHIVWDAGIAEIKPVK